MQTGLYIHIPFCEKKCPYCDFNTYAGLQPLHEQTVDALCLEMERWREPLAARTIRTIFLGGGTPTVLTVNQLARLLETARRCFSMHAACEITSEVNPGTVDRTKFHALRSLGVNRLSIGVQSFQEDELRFLGRIHTVDDIYAAYAAATAAGFRNVNLDFMFGLPGQTVDDWRDTLRHALQLDPTHLSLYSLIVEPHTPLSHWVQRGQVHIPDEDDTAVLYETAIESLENAGYMHYEVSNWSKSAETMCQHNLIYWRNLDYLGIGPGAHSHLRLTRAPSTQPDEEWANRRDDGLPNQPGGGLAQSAKSTTIGAPARASFGAERRWGNHKPVAGYVKRIRAGESVTAFSEEIAPPLARAETMILGLRLLREGVPYAHFERLHDADVRAIFHRELEQLQSWQLVTLDAEAVRLTPAGLRVGNQVFMRFLPDD